jgi:hypothetical protein
MASTYTGLGTELMTTGENASTWGTKTNTNLNILEQIAGGYIEQDIAGSADTTTLSVSDGSTGAVLGHRIIKFTGTITGNQIVTIPLDVQQMYILVNGTSGAYTVQFKYVSGSGSSLTFAATDKGTKIVYATADHATNPNLVDTGISSTGAHDLDGNEFILDADADTSITADTDDQIDIKIAGADDFQFTANTFTAQSGSTIAAQALTATTVTASGIVKTDDTTAATSTTDGSLQTDGGLSVAADAIIGDDLKLLSDSAVLSFGADSDTTLTHTDGTGLTLNSTNKLLFRDTALFINSSTDGQLDIDADTEVEITATTVDLNGILDVSGVIVAGGQISAADGTAGAPSISNTGDLNTGLYFSAADKLTFSAGGTAQITFQDGAIVPVADDDIDLGTSSLQFKDVYVDGTLEADAITIGGSAVVSSPITALNNATANELVTVGATTTELEAEANLTFDGTDVLVGGAGKLQLRDTALFINSSTDGQLDIDADTEVEITTTTVDLNGALDVSGNSQFSGTITVGVDDTGKDVKLFGATSGSYWLWDESADGVVQIGSLTVGVDDAGHDVKFFGDAASAFMLWDASTDDLVLGGAAKLYLYDAGGGENISSDGSTLSIAGGGEIDLTATAIDINGTCDVSGTLTNGSAAVKVVGTETIWIPANAMTPTTSNGCAAIAAVETTSGRPDMYVLDFDKDSDEFAQFTVAFPKSWNAGTVTYQVFWSGLAATGGVSWSVDAVAFANNDSIDTAYGTAVVVDDTEQGAVEEVNVSAVSGAVTIAGSPGDDELCYFRIARDVSDSNDDSGGDARLHGIKLFYTTDAKNDA